MSQRRYSVFLMVFAIACSLMVSLPALADSHARIVRISYIDGDAQVDPTNQDQGFVHAVLNMPVTEGMWIYTPNGGRAEIQFENGSTVRLVDDAQIQFSKLALADSGGKINAIRVDHGVVYFTFDKVAKDDQITIDAGGKTFRVDKNARVRVNAGEKDVQFAVIKGEATLEGDKPENIKGDETLTLAADTGDTKLAKKVDKIGPDSWDQDRDHYLAMLDTRKSTNGNNGFNYPDAYAAQFSYLGAYGNYYSVPGYGMMWQPYGMGPGWDPFMNGLWGMYPGMGYMWISPYPWGWAPYRYGMWNYVPGYGWGWMPGSVFTSYNVGPRYGTVPAGFRAPVQPVVGTGVKAQSLVVVGHPPNVHPEILSGKAYVGAKPNATPVMVKAAKLSGPQVHPMAPAMANSGRQGMGPTRTGGAANAHGGGAPARGEIAPMSHSSMGGMNTGGGRPK